MATPAPRPRKLQRISQACDLCHRRSIRCRPSEENEAVQCQNCFDFGVPCTYLRPSRRRRNGAPHTTGPPNVIPSVQAQLTSSSAAPSREYQLPSSSIVTTPRLSRSPDATSVQVLTHGDGHDDQLLVAWRSFASSNNGRIGMHMEAFMNYVYPIFPLFDGPSLWERLQRMDHLTDRSFFASVMAACALAAARARDGAIPGLSGLPLDNLESETFFTAAQATVAKAIDKDSGIGILQACLLLALTSIQYGDIYTMHQFNGYGHTVCSMQHFHDEKTWPSGLMRAEKEERRRLFWSMYQLDIYVSCVFQSMPRMYDGYIDVSYPGEVDELQVAVPHSTTREPTWLRAFNFTTDLYRILARTLERLRLQNPPITGNRHNIHHLFVREANSTAQILEHVIALYYQQPEELRYFNLPVTGEHTKDIVGYQIANIQATLQLVRMTLVEADPTFDGYQKCDIVHQVITTFTQIHAHFLKAISAPLVHHLGRIGQILASVLQGPLTENLYHRVREQLGSLASLLEDLESGLLSTAGASKELRQQVERIDRHLQEQERGTTRAPLSPCAQQQQQVPARGSDTSHLLESCASSDEQNTMLPHMMSTTLPYRAPAHLETVEVQQTLLVGEFQLPPELTGGWPWPFATHLNNNGQTVTDYGNLQD